MKSRAQQMVYNRHDSRTRRIVIEIVARFGWWYTLLRPLVFTGSQIPVDVECFIHQQKASVPHKNEVLHRMSQCKGSTKK